MYFHRTFPPGEPEPLRVVFYHQLLLESDGESALLDGTWHPLKPGSWMFYLPDIQTKLFHASHGCLDCIHPARPSNDELTRDEQPAGRYQMKEWRQALTTPTTRRLAEVWMVSARLWRAGLGPQPLGICFVDDVARDHTFRGPTCGLLIQNVFTLPRKLRCRIEHIQDAGVVPDKIVSCVRRQVRGYVVDLCSVVGCMPTEPNDVTTQLEHLFRHRPFSVETYTALEATLRATP